jgi:hypothetical protein
MRSSEASRFHELADGGWGQTGCAAAQPSPSRTIPETFLNQDRARPPPRIDQAPALVHSQAQWVRLPKQSRHRTQDFARGYFLSNASPRGGHSRLPLGLCGCIPVVPVQYASIVSLCRVGTIPSSGPLARGFGNRESGTTERPGGGSMPCSPIKTTWSCGTQTARPDICRCGLMYGTMLREGLQNVPSRLIAPAETCMFLLNKDEWKPSSKGKRADDVCPPPSQLEGKHVRSCI